MSAPAPDGGSVAPPEAAGHYYGGQAVLEGVMMRGADRWAVAVRRPDGELWLECHPVSDLPRRRPWLTRPLVRGCYALVDSLAIGMKALGVAADQAFEDDAADDDEGSGVAMGASMALAAVLFVGVFIFLPSAGTKGVDRLVGGVLGDGVWFHLVESVVRIGIFLGYLWSISLLADIRRVFQYHGAEHKTIAAWEHGEVLDPDGVDRHSTLHVRCGTNFLILVMLLATVVYTLGGVLVPPPADVGFLGGVVYHVLLRVVLLPVVAGLAYEGLRLGAAHGDHLLVRALMKPGLWLQLITTKPPTRDQIEVAIRAFEAVVPAEHRTGRVAPGLPSVVTLADDGLPVELTAATTRRDGDPPPPGRDGVPADEGA
ncbi:DUF1385 domain-containing protein [Nitriliruptoraceae bacterium ZYF776]|nr:DUF1385 domain-containing protein [Profundirhabdus halotolerans]